MNFFNVGTGKGSSVLEVIKTFENVSGKKLNYKIVGRREGDVTAAYADTTIANKELNWKTEKKPRRSSNFSLEMAIKTTLIRVVLNKKIIFHIRILRMLGS